MNAKARIHPEAFVTICGFEHRLATAQTFRRTIANDLFGAKSAMFADEKHGARIQSRTGFRAKNPVAGISRDSTKITCQ
jgi:hypothetical protein